MPNEQVSEQEKGTIPEDLSVIFDARDLMPRDTVKLAKLQEMWRLMQERIGRLEQQLVLAQFQRDAAAEGWRIAGEQLGALSWREITPETRFDKSLDYLLGRTLRGSSLIRGDDFQRDTAGKHLIAIGWTHFRAIAPPKVQP